MSIHVVTTMSLSSNVLQIDRFSQDQLSPQKLALIRTIRGLWFDCATGVMFKANLKAWIVVEYVSWFSYFCWTSLGIVGPKLNFGIHFKRQQHVADVSSCNGPFWCCSGSRARYLVQPNHFEEGWMDRIQSSLLVLVKCKLSKLDSCNVRKENILIVGI